MRDGRAGQRGDDLAHGRGVERVQLLVQEGTGGVTVDERLREGGMRTDGRFLGHDVGHRSGEVVHQRIGPETADRVRQRERPRAVRSGARERGDPPSAHRLPDDVGAVGAGFVEHGGHVVDRRTAAVLARCERRVAEAARVPRHDAIARVAERGHLLEPRGMRTARTVRQQHRRRAGVARHLEIDRLTAARDGAGAPRNTAAHVSPPRARCGRRSPTTTR